MTFTLLAHHQSDTAVAMDHRGGQVMTLADLLVDVGTVAATLPEPDAAHPDSHVALVIDSDRYQFAVALLASWMRGHAVALPPNMRRDTVKSIVVRDDVVAVLHDTGAGIGQRMPDLLAPDAPRTAPVAGWARPEREHAATLFTSGSTGTMQAWGKTFDQLLGETAVLAEHFGVQGATTVATVPPAHLYGLLFSVLLPLASGGAFVRGMPFAPAAIAAAVREVAAGALVSVPAHLRACTSLDPGELGGLTRIFTSTAPMPNATALALIDAHRVPVLEVFGSTETGGIATRVQSEATAWGPMPGIQVSVDPETSRLLVDSPFLHPSVERPYVSGDTAQMTEDGRGFVHRGRADDVVKVGGRRVSLLAMARTVTDMPTVDDAATTAVPDPTGRGQKILLAVAGSDDLSVEAIREALLAKFDASSLPRSIRIVPRLPREANGKLVRSEMLRLFRLAPTGEALVESLSWSAPESVSNDDGRQRRRFCSQLPEHYVMFQGHFPGYPVLAGAVQLNELVLPCLELVRPDLGMLCELKGLKFTKRLAPGDAFEVMLSWTPEVQDRVDFEIRRGATICSAGKMRFQTASQA